MKAYGHRSRLTFQIAYLWATVSSILSPTQGQVPEELRKRYLAAHNNARQALEVGIPDLIWDYKLELYANDWADDRAADGCELIQSRGPFGENIVWSNWQSSPEEAVGYWVDEKLYYDGENDICASGRDCTHYTQVVWRDTERLGCWATNCDDHEGNWLHVCSYDPPGNDGGRPYSNVWADS